MTGSRHALVLAAVSLALLAGACAKRPTVTVAAAPAPTAPAPQMAAPPAPAPAPAQVAPTPAPAPAPAPAAAPAPPRPEPKAFVPDPQLADIFFDFDKSAIKPEATSVLKTSADWLKSNPNRSLIIEGHCDERGTEQYNLALGDRRASAAKDYLVAQGVAASRINTVSYGEERPQCTEKNEACWSTNRRAHFILKAQ